MLLPIASKLLSESLLSLYPIFVKKIGISMPLQMWTRLIAYVAISLIFIDWAFIKANIFSPESLALALVNLSHIYFSYEGFLNLESGVSFAIFNTYPLMILLLSGVAWDNAYIFVLIALAFFIYANHVDQQSVKNKEDTDFVYGLGMILLAALTEAFIYFLIRRVKTTNHWNHVFISYLLGAIIMTGYVFMQKDFTFLKNIRVLAATGLNGFIGSVGYFLRFFASYRLDAGIYSVLSYFGIIMSYVYGALFNNETLSIWKILGTVSIFISKALIK
jgi:drug/metabolite transporter (DMT)-like permease